MGYTGEEDDRSLDLVDDMTQISDILTKIQSQKINLDHKEKKIFDRFVSNYNLAAELERERGG